MKIKDIYKTTAWKYFSRYILLKYANKDYIVNCSTSGVWLKITDKNCHCGHYIKAHDHYSVLFDETNVAPQSYAENRFKSGNQIAMRKFLVEKHGIDAIERLEIKKYNTCKLDKFELFLLSEIYKKKFNDLVKIKGNPWK